MLPAEYINMINITLLGEPKSTSHIYKITCRKGFASSYMSSDGKAIKEGYQWQAKSQYKKKILEGELHVIYHIYFGTKRKSDVDNFNKLVGDALSGIVWVDDSQIRRLTVEKFYDKEKPRIEVTVCEV